MATVAADVRHLLDHLGIATVHVIGHDWGTPIGYHPAATARDRVRSFTALEASIPGADGEDLLDFSQSWNPLWFFPFLAMPGLPQQLIGGGRQESGPRRCRRTLPRPEHDRFRPQSRPGSEGVILPGCGHLIPEERPAELARLVTASLAGTASNSR